LGIIVNILKMKDISTDNRLLVMGIGNVLLGDEGVGVHVVRELEKHRLPDHVTLLDGGTGGFHLLEYLQEYPRLVLVDATLDGKPAGTISVLRPRFSHEFPRTLSAHDIGLKDLVESAALLGKLPEIILYTVSVNPEQALSTELSEEIRLAAGQVVEMILAVIW
jgi:hydrogenase maturation protease